MPAKSTIYEITLHQDGNTHIIESFCVEPTDATLIKAIKAAISSLETLGYTGSIRYNSYKEINVLPMQYYNGIRF